jgi:large subunit ribosomal protein L14
MQTLKSSITRGLAHGSVLETCDNSGAKKIKIISVINMKTTKRRKPTAGVGDLVMASVVKGKPDLRKQVVYAVIVRQKQEFRRPDGTRVKFEDNSAVVLKDDKGNPKGTTIKGPIAKESTIRWPGVAKIASMIV